VTHFDASEDDQDFHFGETPDDLLARLARERDERDRAAGEEDELED
jgi:hypothetical protein